MDIFHLEKAKVTQSAFILSDRFQAIECFLANVQSLTQNYPESWDAPAIAHFEQLVQGNIIDCPLFMSSI